MNSKIIVKLNINATAEKITLPLEKAGISVNVKVRDLWLKSDLAKATGGFEVEFAANRAKLLMIE